MIGYVLLIIVLALVFAALGVGGGLGTIILKFIFFGSVFFITLFFANLLVKSLLLKYKV